MLIYYNDTKTRLGQATKNIPKRKLAHRKCEREATKKQKYVMRMVKKREMESKWKSGRALKPVHGVHCTFKRVEGKAYTCVQMCKLHSAILFHCRHVLKLFSNLFDFSERERGRGRESIRTLVSSNVGGSEIFNPNVNSASYTSYTLWISQCVCAWKLLVYFPFAIPLAAICVCSCSNETHVKQCHAFEFVQKLQQQ